MPDTPTPTPTASAQAEAAPAAKHRQAERIAVPRAPADPALDLMEKAAKTVLDADLTKLAKDIHQGIGAYLDHALPAPPEQIAKQPWRSPRGPIIEPSHQREHDIGMADLQYEDAKAQAEADLRTAGRTWTKATKAYAKAVGTAEGALHGAVETEEKAYGADHRAHQVDDPLGRNAQVFMTSRNNVAQALQGYEAALATAATTLGGALGDLYAAYAACAVTVAKAEAARAVAIATAEQAFWTSVDGIRSKIN